MTETGRPELRELTQHESSTLGQYFDLNDSMSSLKVGPAFPALSLPRRLSIQSRVRSAIEDTLHPDKVVIGSLDKQSGTTLSKLYRGFYKKQQPPTILTSPETAEMVKYASNAFLATKISYINTIANICQQIPRVDVEKIAHTIGLDPRIGPLFLKAGPGYGGSCFHKDLQALIQYSQSHGYDPTYSEPQKTPTTNKHQESYP